MESKLLNEALAGWDQHDQQATFPVATQSLHSVPDQEYYMIFEVE